MQNVQKSTTVIGLKHVLAIKCVRGHPNRADHNVGSNVMIDFRPFCTIGVNKKRQIITLERVLKYLNYTYSNNLSNVMISRVLLDTMVPNEQT